MQSPLDPFAKCIIFVELLQSNPNAPDVTPMPLRCGRLVIVLFSFNQQLISSLCMNLASRRSSDPKNKENELPRDF